MAVWVRIALSNCWMLLITDARGRQVAVRYNGWASVAVRFLRSGLAINLILLPAKRRPGPAVGPPSIGHAARFVPDHAPSLVLLLRGEL